MHLVEKGSKFSLDMAILLWQTWSSIFKLPSPSCVHAFLKTIFSPALLQQRYCTCILYLFFKFLIKPCSHGWTYLKRKLHRWLLLSSITSYQCFSLPKVRVEGEHMSKKAFLPKFLIKQWPFCSLLAIWPFPSCNLHMACIPMFLAVVWSLTHMDDQFNVKVFDIFLARGSSRLSLSFTVSSRNSTLATQL